MFIKIEEVMEEKRDEAEGREKERMRTNTIDIFVVLVVAEERDVGRLDSVVVAGRKTPCTLHLIESITKMPTFSFLFYFEFGSTVHNLYGLDFKPDYLSKSKLDSQPCCIIKGSFRRKKKFCFQKINFKNTFF